jgi:hypothetical protein
VTVLDDGETEPDETLGLALANPSGAGLGTNASASLTIATADPLLRFSKAAASVTEATARAPVTVTRTPPTPQQVTVDYATMDGTAAAGSDYAAVSGTLTFPPGAVARSFYVPIVNDTDSEGGETVTLMLSNPSAAALLGTPSQAVLTITSNDAAGMVQFAVADSSVAETGPYAAIRVTRTGGQAGNASVDYAASDGTAAAYVNYLPASGTLVFGSGEMSKTILVTVLDDGVAGGSSRLSLALSNPQGGAALGARTTATLWIVETP